MEEIIVGGVGVLQFDVLEQRLQSEYNVEIKLERFFPLSVCSLD